MIARCVRPTVVCAVLALVALLTPGCKTGDEWVNPVSTMRERLHRHKDVGTHVYFFNFDRGGRMVTPQEVERALDDIQTVRFGRHEAVRQGIPIPVSERPIERIVVVSLGWGHEPTRLYDEYFDVIDAFTGIDADGNHPGTAPDGAEPEGDTVVICVSWESSQESLRRFLNDILPVPFVGDVIAWIPDTILFPLSFWSKAGLANRIGNNGLRNALEDLIDDAFPQDDAPPIYLIGHSFGCRVMNGIMMAEGSVANAAFAYRNRIAGVVFLQPAVSVFEGFAVGTSVSYPMVVTRSQYDRANSLLFPIANIILNATTFELVEELTTMIWGHRPSGSGGAEVFRDTAAIPVSLAAVIVITPLLWVAHHVQSFGNRPLQHITDTLSATPGTSVLVKAVESDTSWSAREKGLWSLGAFVESSGRGSAYILPGSDFPARYVPENLLHVLEEPDWPSGGFHHVDCSQVIRTGAYGQDMHRWYNELVTNWLDPVGAHSDFHEEEIYRLIRRVLRMREPKERGGDR